MVIDNLCVELAEGLVKRGIVTIAPRYGKSFQGSIYFPAWHVGTWPDRPLIQTSYEASLAHKFSAAARDVLDDVGRDVFGVRLARSGVRGEHGRGARSDWNVLGKEGGVYAGGVGTGIAGRGAFGLIIDDPHKDADDAFSQRARDKKYDWYLSTVLSRLEPDAWILLIMQRWHVDDMVGRLIRIEGAKNWKVITMPEIAEPSIQGPDPLGRKDGEVLCPSRFSKEQVYKKRDQKCMESSYWWDAQNQQRPRNPDGVVFRRDWIRFVDHLLADSFHVRAWDLAGTDEAKKIQTGDWIAGVKESWRRHDGLLSIDHVVRFRGSSGQVFNTIVATAHLDGPGIPIRIEREGGGSPGIVIDQLRKALPGYNIKGAPARREKRLRWDSLAAYMETGHVVLQRGAWNSDFIDELTLLPGATHDDQADAAALAYICLSEIVKNEPRIVVLGG